MTEVEAAAWKVTRAIFDPGIRPDVHWQAWERLNREWPTLANAIRQLIAVTPSPNQARRLGPRR